MKSTDRAGMDECNNMVIYGQWSYMTISGTIGVRFMALSEELQIDMLLFEESSEE
jgi:hypothetical protein